MNKLTIIGNLVADPVLRTTNSGLSVCSFKVAVNRRKKVEGQPEADFFQVSVWRQLADLCQKYLAKGRKVCVMGNVSVSTYEGRDGKTYANLDVTADDIEFLTPKGDSPAVDSSSYVPTHDVSVSVPAASVEVESSEDLPF